MILWFNYNVLDAVNVVVFYLVIISDATNEFLPEDDKDLLNWIESTVCIFHEKYFM